MKKKVLIIAPPESAHTVEWIEFLNKQERFEIFYISLKKDFKPVKNSFFIDFSYPFYKINLLKSYFEVKRIIKSISPDIVHAHYLFPYGILTLFDRKKTVISFWGSDITKDYKNSNLIFKSLADLSIKDADFITFAGKHLKSFFKYDIENSEILIWGVNSNFVESVKKMDRRELGFSDDDFVILNLRYIRDIFQIERIIDVVKDLNQKFSNIKLILVKGDDSPYFNMIKEKCKDLPFVKILENLSKEKFISLIKSSDITLSLSTRDGNPVSVKEAMICRKTVIYQEIEPMREFFENKDFKTSLKTFECKELYEKILYFYNDRNTLKNIGNQMKKFAEENFDKEKCFQKGLKIYNKIIGD
ncbi:MAG: glycosyltransferase family 4 protein [bacterium]|nr:glycosyltransferase family 4 protein [bacterium]